MEDIKEKERTHMWALVFDIDICKMHIFIWHVMSHENYFRTYEENNFGDVFTNFWNLETILVDTHKCEEQFL